MLIDVILSSVSYAIWSLSSIFTLIPPPKENITITYTLYTPENPHPTILNNIDDITINPDYELKILCHGWSFMHYSTQWYNKTVEEYLIKGGVNVITANYSNAVSNVMFYKTIKYASNVGSQIGNLILNLNASKGIPFDKVHILGHLLGAHIAGVAGETIYKKTGKTIDRITGLDPPSIGFFKFNVDGRLSRNDAVFVDVIHTSSSSYFDTIGRIDFYGYTYLSKCPYNWRISDIMAPIYYANSINGVGVLNGTKCLKRNYFSWNKCKRNVSATLGENVDRAMFGKFNLNKDYFSKYVCNVKTFVTTTATPTAGTTNEDAEE